MNKSELKSSLYSLFQKARESNISIKDIFTIIQELYEEVYLSGDRSFREVSDNYKIPTPLLQKGGVELDLIRNVVEYKGKKVNLYPKNALLLGLLMERTGKIVSYEMILEQVFDDANQEKPYNVLFVTVSRLRKQLKPLASGRTWIKTIKDKGYEFQPPEES